MLKQSNYISQVLLASSLFCFSLTAQTQPKNKAELRKVKTEINTNSNTAVTKNQQIKNKLGAAATTQQNKNTIVDRFADIQVLYYKVPSWDKLTLEQKQYAYHLAQAAYAGRDIIWDQNYRHNLEIRSILEKIYQNRNADRTTKEFKAFEVYTKRVWFSNGIHHHYSMNKIMPEFSKDWFTQQCMFLNIKLKPEIEKAIFDPNFDAKKVNLDPNKGLVKGSAVNFYDADITEAEVDDYYTKLIPKNEARPLSYGLNSKLVRINGNIEEEVYKVGGKYGPALEAICAHLKKAIPFAENKGQAAALKVLIQFYQTGDLKLWDEYNILWAANTDGDIDYISGFVEVYNDPKGYTGSYESIIQIKDFEMTAKMEVLAKEAQWFEDHSSIEPNHKKKNVVGVSYKVVQAAAEAGDASPATPIGINLPNANWIRSEHGSKSVSLGNIVQAYNEAGGSGILKEFVHDNLELRRVLEHGKLAAKLHTAMHEVIGHASGKINPGIGTPKETLKSYASTLEEARADLVALYFLLDEKLVQMGLMPSIEVGKAEYDNYLRNGLMTQLVRIEPGAIIEEAHMRNRQMVAAWVMERAEKIGAAKWVIKDGKHYIDITDYNQLRNLFGELLKEIQRIKSEGDYEAGKNLVENYGVQVNPEIHKEVLDRTKNLNIAPYSGFVNPQLVEIFDANGNLIDIQVQNEETFPQQMLRYAREFHFLK